MEKKVVTEEEIQSALNFLEGFSKGDKPDFGGKCKEKEPDDDDDDIDENGNKKIKKSEKEKEPDNDADDTKALVKSLRSDFDSRNKALGTINKFLVDQNAELIGINTDLQKSINTMAERLENIGGLVEEMANSPFNKLAGTIKKSIAVDKFGKEENVDGKKALSLTQNKREVLNLLVKSLNDEEGQRRLGNVVGLIENGYVNQNNFEALKKSVENEIGGNYIINL